MWCCSSLPHCLQLFSGQTCTPSAGSCQPTASLSRGRESPCWLDHFPVRHRPPPQQADNQEEGRGSAGRSQAKTGSFISFNITQRSSLGSHWVWIQNVPRPSINWLCTNTSTFLWRSSVNMKSQLKVCTIWMRRVVREEVGIKIQTGSTLYTGCIGLNTECVVGISSLLQPLNVFVQMVPTCFRDLSFLGKNLQGSGLRLTLVLGMSNCPFFEEAN